MPETGERQTGLIAPTLTLSPPSASLSLSHREREEPAKPAKGEGECGTPGYGRLTTPPTSGAATPVVPGKLIGSPFSVRTAI